ncbi:hypothetical protein C5167_011890 [Papaver somniferum]|uniref:Uncharacterized protein n=1 Tax=Papaver somniferum TaxID=3469 RepID=A0A4Y7IZV5_PAPSO|nr:hypothetical protein C5167_011890 [Papaver somniferum]
MVFLREQFPFSFTRPKKTTLSLDKSWLRARLHQQLLIDFDEDPAGTRFKKFVDAELFQRNAKSGFLSSSAYSGVPGSGMKRRLMVGRLGRNPAY